MRAFIKQIVPQSVKNIYHLFQAIAAVSWFRYPAKGMVVIGVTGTDGKTTTSTLIYEIVKAAGYKTALISTVAAYIGQEAVDTGFHVTSPDPWPLQQMLRRIKKAGFTHVVLEATSHGLDQHRLWGIPITYAVYTNITSEHLDYHKTYPNYVKAKAKLMRSAKAVMLNRDDQSYELLIKKVPKTCRIYPYTLTKTSSWVTLAKNRFTEPYNQANSLAACTVAYLLKIPKSAVKIGLEKFKGIPGRMQPIPNHRGLHIFVDFAHTPNALESALTSVRQTFAQSNVIAVYGAAGERDAFKRPAMGEIGARLADEVVLTAEDPRSESVHSIIQQMKSGITQNHGHVHTIIDRSQAIDIAINTLAKKGDVVILLGKGHEQSMNLDGKTEIPWSDASTAQTCLNNYPTR
jgi:UDP-N-acetylmuramoyl-L-alanyl-D-glutamate--2,6-diaminopimelate ligase